MTNEDIHAVLHKPHVVDCRDCLFKHFEHDGHCYMFARPPDSHPTYNRCGQFRKHVDKPTYAKEE